MLSPPRWTSSSTLCTIRRVSGQREPVDLCRRPAAIRRPCGCCCCWTCSGRAKPTAAVAVAATSLALAAAKPSALAAVIAASVALAAASVALAAATKPSAVAAVAASRVSGARTPKCPLAGPT
jgi:hypothetical protein